MSKRLQISLSVMCLVTNAYPVAATDDFERAQAFYNRGDMQSAVQLWSKLAVSAKKNDPICHYYLANTLLRLGKLSEARAEYRQVLLLHPNSQLTNYCNKVLRDHQSIDPNQSATEQEIKGYVGIKVVKNVVKEVFPRSPAEECGIEAGDVILSVDGKSTYGLSKEEVANMLIGPIGKRVDVILDHQGKRQELMLVRAKPGEQLSQALADESKKKEAAAKQDKFVKAQKIDDIDKELITVFRRTQDTSEIYAQVLGVLHLIPRPIKQDLFDGNCKIVITPTLLEADKITYHYFVQPDAAGPSELFAELFALSISNKGGITERSASLKTVFPLSFEYMKKCLR